MKSWNSLIEASSTWGLQAFWGANLTGLRSCVGQHEILWKFGCVVKNDVVELTGVQPDRTDQIRAKCQVRYTTNRPMAPPANNASL
jgi:hypothetical protein